MLYGRHWYDCELADYCINTIIVTSSKGLARD